MNIGAHSSRVAINNDITNDKWGRELAITSGRCLSLAQDSVRFLAGSVCCTLLRAGPNSSWSCCPFGVQFNLLHFFPLSLVRSVRGYLLQSTGGKSLNILVTFDMGGRDRFMGASFMPSCMLMM